MKLNTNNYKYKELTKWYRRPANSHFKKNLNDFKNKYFNDKSYIDIYVNCFLMKTDELRKVKGYMGFTEYKYPMFLSFIEIYNNVIY